jgi:hypothetical protein
MHTYEKLAISFFKVEKLSTDKLNRHMKEGNMRTRFITWLDKISVSEKAEQKINKIIKEDKS